jgi:hypothetical protein
MVPIPWPGLRSGFQSGTRKATPFWFVLCMQPQRHQGPRGARQEFDRQDEILGVRRTSRERADGSDSVLWNKSRPFFDSISQKSRQSMRGLRTYRMGARGNTEEAGRRYQENGVPLHYSGLEFHDESEYWMEEGLVTTCTKNGSRLCPTTSSRVSMLALFSWSATSAWSELWALFYTDRSLWRLNRAVYIDSELDKNASRLWLIQGCMELIWQERVGQHDRGSFFVFLFWFGLSLHAFVNSTFICLLHY